MTSLSQVVVAVIDCTFGKASSSGMFITMHTQWTGMSIQNQKLLCDRLDCGIECVCVCVLWHWLCIHRVAVPWQSLLLFPSAN